MNRSLRLSAYALALAGIFTLIIVFAGGGPTGAPPGPGGQGDLPGKLPAIVARLDALELESARRAGEIAALQVKYAEQAVLIAALEGENDNLALLVDTVPRGWSAHALLDQEPGPLPLGGSIKTGGGTLIVLASGTAYRTEKPHIGMEIYMDGVRVGDSRSYSSQPSSHQAFAPAFLVLPDVPPGLHTFELIEKRLGPSGKPGTITDWNDFFSLTVIELR